MTCPLCKLEVPESDLIPNPYWQDDSLQLAHAMNPAWDEAEGCCRVCLDKILDTIETKWVPTHPFPIRGLKDGFRYVLTKRESGNWNHINPDLQRWWQKKIVIGIGDKAIELGLR